MIKRFRVTNDPPEKRKYENMPAISHISPTGCHWYKPKKKTQKSNGIFQLGVVKVLNIIEKKYLFLKSSNLTNPNPAALTTPNHLKS